VSVVQLNVWTCDFCGAAASTLEQTSPWSDPLVVHPEGWSTLEIPPAARKHPSLNVGDACPACLRQIALIDLQRESESLGLYDDPARKV
jgi:hypothetical protein